MRGKLKRKRRRKERMRTTYNTRTSSPKCANGIRNSVVNETCPNKDACPHLGFQSCSELLAENERLKHENQELRRIFDVATEAFKKKEAEIANLKHEFDVVQRKLKDLLQKPFQRKGEEENRSKGTDRSTQEDKKPSRKKRGAPVGHRGGTRKKPTRNPDVNIFVPAEECPKCNSKNISQCKAVQEHIIEDILLVPVSIIVRYKRQQGYCRDCGQVFFSRLPEDIPNGHIGPVARAIAGYLRYAIKIPFASVTKIFKSLWGLDITAQALVGFDKKLAEKGRPLYELIEQMVRYSDVANADETSWPVGWINKWLWTIVNQTFVFFKIDKSRAGTVPENLLGKNYGGVLGSDCFSAYNIIKAKAKQKCLAHYERAAKDLEKFYPDDNSALLFASCLKDIFKRARQVKRNWLQENISDQQATRMAEDFEQELDDLTNPQLESKDAENLRKRLITHREENFTFLRYKDVPPDNNIAERALRPSVVMRKITYGNNSDTGAHNHETLMTLIETSKLHGTNPLDLMTGLASGMNCTALEKMLFGVPDGENVMIPDRQDAAPS